MLFCSCGIPRADSITTVPVLHTLAHVRCLASTVTTPHPLPTQTNRKLTTIETKQKTTHGHAGHHRCRYISNMLTSESTTSTQRHFSRSQESVQQRTAHLLAELRPVRCKYHAIFGKLAPLSLEHAEEHRSLRNKCVNSRGRTRMRVGWGASSALVMFFHPQHNKG